MKIKRQIIVFDAADLAAESAFWAGLLGGTVVADDDWRSFSVLTRRARSRPSIERNRVSR